jgi:hypothetical protein
MSEAIVDVLTANAIEPISNAVEIFLIFNPCYLMQVIIIGSDTLLSSVAIFMLNKNSCNNIPNIISNPDFFNSSSIMQN